MNEESKKYMIETLNEGADKHTQKANMNLVSGALFLGVGAISSGASVLAFSTDTTNCMERALMVLIAVGALYKGAGDMKRYMAAKKQAQSLRAEADRIKNQKQR